MSESRSERSLDELRREVDELLGQCMELVRRVPKELDLDEIARVCDELVKACEELRGEMYDAKMWLGGGVLCCVHKGEEYRIFAPPGWFDLRIVEIAPEIDVKAIERALAPLMVGKQVVVKVIDRRIAVAEFEYRRVGVRIASNEVLQIVTDRRSGERHIVITTRRWKEYARERYPGAYGSLTTAYDIDDEELLRILRYDLQAIKEALEDLLSGRFVAMARTRARYARLVTVLVRMLP